MKRMQDLLEINLPRDNRMQAALNNAPGESSFITWLFPQPQIYFSSLPAHDLKNPIKWKREVHSPCFQLLSATKDLNKMKLTRSGNLINTVKQMA